MGSCLVLIRHERVSVRVHKRDDVILYTPLDEIQLRHGRLNFLICSRNGVRNLLRATEGVEQLFTIAQERTLVRGVDGEDFAVVRLVRGVIFLGVVRDEPLQVSKGDS
jgi:hypothetical protein